ncbi:hypothetical protein [uncultured Selenomonas sp.]|uniref:hypothetical protein n=1 Tax=uncultured Selenomonas sp. TaxID=159275 RepID=UPI0028EC9018|nr:hypothetical protein [uncultured Selenomonas sp.]
MTINISITERDLAGAQKNAIANLICSLQALSTSTGIKSEISASSEIGTEIDLLDVPHKTKSSETVIVPDKVYKDEPIPAKTAPKEKTKPAPAPMPEPETNSAEEVAAEDSTAVPAPDDAKTDYKKLRETVKAECAAIARSGKSKALKALLVDCGVEKLSEISDVALEDFLKEARAL